jgi:hypothetical protein
MRLDVVVAAAPTKQSSAAPSARVALGPVAVGTCARSRWSDELVSAASASMPTEMSRRRDGAPNGRRRRTSPSV